MFGSLGIQSVVIVDYFIRQDYYTQVLCVNKDNKPLKCNGKCQIKGFLEVKNDAQGKPVLPTFQFKFIGLAPEFFDKENRSPFTFRMPSSILYKNDLKDYIIVNSNYPPPKQLLALA